MVTPDELRAVLRSATDEVVLPPGLLDGVRRRMRRRTRRRSLAAGFAAAAACAALLVPGLDGDPPPVPSIDAAKPVTGMRLVKTVAFDRLYRTERVDFTALGRDVVVVAQCEGFYVFVDSSDLTKCGGNIRTWSDPAEHVSMEIMAFPQTVLKNGSIEDLIADMEEGTLPPPIPKTWTIQIYSGTCDGVLCKDLLPPAVEPSLPIEGLQKLGTRTGTADARTRAFAVNGVPTRLRLVCLEGAGWAVIWRDGRPGDPIDCESREPGVIWDEPAAASLEITIFPASVTNPSLVDEPRPTAARLRALARNAEPAGKWTLTIFKAP